MRQIKQVSSATNNNHRRPTILYLVCAAALFSLLLFALQSSFFAGSLYSDRNSDAIRVLSHFQSTVQQCVANRGLGLTAHIIDHCSLILKYPEGTNSTWYNQQFKKFEPLEYTYDVCEAILLWEQYRNMTTVLTREYLDSRPGGWLDYAPLRIAQLGAKKCYNKTLCEEHLNILLPAKPPFHPRQFRTCAVVGNSGDLLKTEFGKEIDSHDAVFRDNEAPVNQKYAKYVGLKRDFRLVVRGAARNMVPILNGSVKTQANSVKPAKNYESRHEGTSLKGDVISSLNCPKQHADNYFVAKKPKNTVENGVVCYSNVLEGCGTKHKFCSKPSFNPVSYRCGPGFNPASSCPECFNQARASDDEVLIIKSLTHKEINAVIKTIPNPVYLFQGIVLRRGAKGTGMKSIELALSMCDIVDIYGFTVDPGYTEWTRYFSAPRKGHNPLQGRAYYQLLECLGVIRIHSPMRSKRRQDWSDVPSREMISQAHAAAWSLRKSSADQARSSGQFGNCKVWSNVDPDKSGPISGSPDMSDVRKYSNYSKWEVMPLTSLRKETQNHYSQMQGVSLYKMDGNKLDDLVCVRHSLKSEV